MSHPVEEPRVSAASRLRGGAWAEVAAFLLALVAIAESAWVACNVFERLPHIEDEMASLWQAEVMAEGQIALPSPEWPRSFMIPFVVDHDGQRFGKYPPGWPAALSLGARAGAPWAVNALLSGITAWLVYRLGARVLGKGLGLLAEALTLASPMSWMLSGSLMGHSLSLFLSVAFWLAWVDLFVPAKSHGLGRRVPEWLKTAAAGLALGLLALTRPLTAVGVALPCALHGAWILIRGSRAGRWRVLGIALLAGLVAAILLIWQAALTGDPWLNPYTLWWPYDRLGFGPGVGRTESGHNLHWAIVNTTFSLRAGVHDLFGWPYLSWVFLPFGAWALRRSAAGRLLAAVLPGLVLVYGIYWIGSWLLGPRYYYESLPALAILTAAGAGWIGGWARTRSTGWRRWRGPAVAAALGVLVALNLLYYVPARVGGLRGLYGVSREHQQSFVEALPDHALVFVHPARAWTEYGTLITLAPPFSERNLILAYSRGREQDARAAGGFEGWSVYHYYGDEPGVFYSGPRDG